MWFSENQSMSQKQKKESMERTQVTKVIGGPGTGKTTAVVGNPELEINGLFLDHMEEYGLSEQLLVTYTKGAVEEAKDRLKKMTGIPKKDLDSQVRTIHSHAYNRMGVESGQLIQHQFKKKFCDEQGLEFEYDDDTEDLVSLGGDTADGNMLFRINDWLNAYRLDPEDHEECPVDYDGKGDVVTLLKAWHDYKNLNDKLEFSDMIEGVVTQCVATLRQVDAGDTSIVNDREYLRSCRNDEGLMPKAVRSSEWFIDEPVLYVDECQDLTYLQWDWYLCQKLAAEKVFLGGDDDQSIYGWAGAEPEDQLLAEEGEVRVLEKTYRIPKQVWQACDSCIQQVETRQEKNIEPVDDEGEFIALSQYQSSAHEVATHLKQTDDAFVLFRAKYHILEFSKELNKLGVPYKHVSFPFQTWSNDLLKIRGILKKLVDGDSITADELGTLTDEMPNKFIDAKQPGMVKYTMEESEYKGSAVYDFFQFTLNNPTPKSFALWYANSVAGWEDQEYNGYQGDALRENIRRDLMDRDPESVKLMTIHKAKGKEADTVILGTDSTSTIMANMSGAAEDMPPGTTVDRLIAGMDGTDISDTERRVMYVGMSRAERKLVMAEGLVTPDTTLQIKALVGGGNE